MAFTYPITLDVTGRRCVVVGQGAAADERAQALCAAGGDVVQHATFRPGVLDGAFLAVVADSTIDAPAIRREAAQQRVLLNVVDDPQHCDFAFPALVRRGDLRVAISTGGSAPALARAVRERLDDELHPELGTLVDVLGEVRAATLPRTTGFSEWARRWRDALTDLDGLLYLLRQGRRDEVRRRVHEVIA